MNAFTVDGRTLELLSKRIDQKIDDVKTEVAYGQPHVIPDFAMYQRRVGQIMGLMDAKEFIAQARADAEQEAAPRQATG